MIPIVSPLPCKHLLVASTDTISESPDERTTENNEKSYKQLNELDANTIPINSLIVMNVSSGRMKKNS